MSDDENIHSEEEEGPEDSGPSEAQLAMQKRREKQRVISSTGLDEDAQELLESNRQEREKMADEIEELRIRSEKRKRERQEEERQMTKRRNEEEAKRKADEEERRGKKDAEENRKREERAKKLAEFEKWKNPTTPNFQITKRDRPAASGEGEEEDPEVEKISKEQLEAEKKAILGQRIQPLNINGFDSAKLAEKAKELHNLMFRLESEKYDLEKRFKNQQYDMMELAERARAMNKVGKEGTLKRVQLPEDESDKIQERFAGCPCKILMFSEFDRQMDKRPYVERRGKYTGPVYAGPADKVAAERRVIWDENTGLPTYEELPGVVTAEEDEEE